MKIKWTSDLSVDVKEIDGQHKELFKRINNLDTAMKKGRAKEEILGLIEFLDEYVVIHFRTEELYMIRYDYPRYPFHKTKHAWFKKEFSVVRKKLEKEGPTPEVIILSNNLLITWFSGHIRTTDTALGAYLRPKLARI
ncbi:MAG: bacteriohemerythrin [Nitrospiraceae bacterium]|nr:bacteriohemerythrin [Nitrospiraceae bacterium]MDA8433859.1 bacteriohemerythrin [Nitrospiraceae bacterium]